MLTQLSALVPEAKLKLKDFGERYCLSNNPKAYSKYDGQEPFLLLRRAQVACFEGDSKLLTLHIVHGNGRLIALDSLAIQDLS